MESTASHQSYIKLVIHFDSQIEDQIKNSIDQIMLEKLHCDGIEDLSLSEQELNDLLGNEAVTGGPLPGEVLETLEKYAQTKKDKSSTYYFYGENCLNLATEANIFLQSEFSKSCIKHSEILECAEESWLEKWKEHYHPIEISNDFIVLPSWHDPTAYQHQTHLRIDPGQAFGTGSHESTKLCLSLIHTYFAQDNSLKILDFGCGSGILSLAHTKLNPSAITFLYDIDPAAYDNIVVNRNLNNIDENTTILIPAGEELPPPWKQQQFDLVMANILLPILLNKAQLLSSLVRTNGSLLISGIMIDQWEELFEALSQQARWEFIDQKELNSWKAVLIKRLS